MTEQVEGVLSAEVDEASRTITYTGVLGAETSGASPEGQGIMWDVKTVRIGNVHLIGRHSKTLTERFNEAYDEDAKKEDEEFFKTSKAYYRRRRFNTED